MTNKIIIKLAFEPIRIKIYLDEQRGWKPYTENQNQQKLQRKVYG
jgi:hypothetical protein